MRPTISADSSEAWNSASKLERNAVAEVRKGGGAGGTEVSLKTLKISVLVLSNVPFDNPTDFGGQRRPFNPRDLRAGRPARKALISPLMDELERLEISWTRSLRNTQVDNPVLRREGLNDPSSSGARESREQPEDYLVGGDGERRDRECIARLEVQVEMRRVGWSGARIGEEPLCCERVGESRAFCKQPMSFIQRGAGGANYFYLRFDRSERPRQCRPNRFESLGLCAGESALRAVLDTSRLTGFSMGRRNTLRCAHRTSKRPASLDHKVGGSV